MILIKQNGQVYEISFRYDPTIVQLIKQVPLEV
nr:MAG TPA: HepA-related protein (HARP) [Caudoviricetes sp.]